MTVIDRHLSARGVKHRHQRLISMFCYRKQCQLQPAGTVAERADQYTHLLVPDVWQHKWLHVYPSWLCWRLPISELNDCLELWAVSLVLAMLRYESRFTEYRVHHLVCRVISSVVRTPVVFLRFNESRSHYRYMWQQCIEQQHWPTWQPRPLIWIVSIAWTNGIPSSPDAEQRRRPGKWQTEIGTEAARVAP